MEMSPQARPDIEAFLGHTPQCQGVFFWHALFIEMSGRLFLARPFQTFSQDLESLCTQNGTLAIFTRHHPTSVDSLRLFLVITTPCQVVMPPPHAPNWPATWYLWQILYHCNTSVPHPFFLQIT